MNPIKVLPVYSRLSQSDPIAGIPTGLSLREHQVKTFDAIRDPDVDVVFNTAMTGDGKSLAAYLPALVDNRRILAMYPTNELILDQRKQIKSYCSQFNSKITPECMFSEHLYELRAELELGSQAKAIKFLAGGHEVLLTNPDIFNLIANFKYMSEHQNPDRLLQILLNCYDVFLFDEFHIYDVSQVISVLTAMLYIIEQTRGTRNQKKFVFLSATPNPLLLECLKQSGLRYKIIDGDYHVENADEQNWNQICQPFTLHFHSVGRQTEAWIQSHYQEIVNWFSDNPDSRGAIIVNSVATAKRIIAFFKERDFPWSFGEITGITGKLERESARKAKLIVGTSTVDVGIDFEINYLIFEALDSGSWVQRLGRLGRHKGYKQDDGKKVAFTKFVAYSLLPKYVAERTETADIPEVINKASLIESMQNEEKNKRLFSPTNDFRNYQRSWGWLHPAHVINTLGHPRLRDNYALLREQLTETYKDVFKVDISERVKWYYKITQDQPEIIENSVTQFRGETPFTCGILDETDGEIKTYDLLWVLRNADTEWINKYDFMQTVEARDIQTHKYRYVDVHLRLLKYRPEPERLRLRYNKAILSGFDADAYCRVKVRQGFQIDSSFQDINKINRLLKHKKLLCLIRKEPTDELRARLRLPPLFGISPLVDSEGNPLSIIFFKDALMLQSLPYIWAGEE
ncbi:type I-D CRISPR-associated helicase Cas3' [Candidatus Poribacteria bacterium]|nr:type I-D CRISPR-associated helicase Cas3' [Candidatus Poribacteria bacterium]MYK24020.1 type I-D CRISPR-associated helicase Cas3' [Candidatus Poribacteria bacterium]